MKTYTAEELLAAIPPADGEKRVVYKCRQCGNLFGRRFIPYGLGRGLTVNACACVLTQNCAPADKVTEVTP